MCGVSHLIVMSSSLREALGEHLWAYEIPEDDLVGEVLVPSMRSASEVRIAAGYFTSGCLAQVAPGLADYLANGNAPLQLLMSPFVSDEDYDAIRRAIRTPSEVLNGAIARILREGRDAESALVRHTVDCLAYLVASNRLQLRVVLMHRGQYHKKQWFFRSGEEWLVVHGSGNATSRGMLVNGEQMSLDATWTHEHTARQRIEKFLAGWDASWSGRSGSSVVLEPRDALDFLSTIAPQAPPTHADFTRACEVDPACSLKPSGQPVPRLTGARLRVPAALNWSHGPYQHQARAVEAFESANCRGILQMATGGGKTKAALVAATRFQDRADGPCLIMVMVPTRPLVEQWRAEITAFGVAPLVLSETSATEKGKLLEETKLLLATKVQTTVVLIATNSYVAQSQQLRRLIEDCPQSASVLLVADEAHNLGAEGFISCPLQRPTARLGLSATPIRQYDSDGTTKLLKYFGGIVFTFDLGDAIRAGCLVPYEYHPHEVVLEEDEFDEYQRLTRKIIQLGYADGSDEGGGIRDNLLEQYLRDRRAIVENARGKISRLRALLMSGEVGSVKRSLFYASAKRSKLSTAPQIELVNGLLRDLGISFHQITSEETSNGEAERYLGAFAKGELAAVTAMKVLDEGVDVPAAASAFLLGSSNVEREWVQRRGRVLRRSEGKESAVIHDFFVCPPSFDTGEAKSLLKGEFRRAEAFATLSSNEWKNTGPRKKLLSRLRLLI